MAYRGTGGDEWEHGHALDSVASQNVSTCAIRVKYCEESVQG